MKHKFYGEIVAWAKGEKVEYRKLGSNEWRDELDDFPYWDSLIFEYRIKPQPKEPQYLYVWKDGQHNITLTTNPPHPAQNIYNLKVIGKIKLEDESE